MGVCISVCIKTPSLTPNEAATTIQTAMRGKIARVAAKSMREQRQGVATVRLISHPSPERNQPEANTNPTSISQKFDKGSFPEKLYLEAFDLLEKKLSEKETGNVVLSLFTGEAKFEASFLEHLQRSKKTAEYQVKIKKLICVDQVFHSQSREGDLFNNLYELQDQGLVQEIVLLPSFSELSDYLAKDREKVDLAFSVHRNMPAFLNYSLEQLMSVSGDVHVEIQFANARNQGEYAQAMSSPELSETCLIHISGLSSDQMGVEETTCYGDATEYFNMQQKSIGELQRLLNKQDERSGNYFY